MPPALIAPLVAFLLLALVAALLVRRFFGTAGDWRADAEFRARAAEIAQHGDTVLGTVIGPVDEVRRRRAEAAPLVPLLRAVADEIQVGIDEASAARPPDGEQQVITALTADLERAARAVELVLHGCAVLETTRDGRRGEGEVAIKRGYLNLLHAREELRARAKEAEPAVELKLSWRRRAS